MKIILLTEGNLLEDRVIISRIPNKYKLDRSILSKNVSFTNFFKYDLLIISFVPSFGTPHFKLVESMLRLKKIVVSMNMDQNNFHFDYACRSNSYEYLCKLGLKLFAIDKNFDEFLAKLKLSSKKLKLENGHSNNDGNGDILLCDNVIFIFDLRWATATEKYIIYKKNVGYSDSVIGNAINYSLTYIENIVTNHEEIIKKFKFKRAYIYIESLSSFEKIQGMYNHRFLSSIEIVNTPRLLELLLQDSIVLTNWHSIELINSQEGIKIYRIYFHDQTHINFFSQILPVHASEERFSNITDDRFELLPIKLKPVFIDLEAVYSRSRCKNLGGGIFLKSGLSFRSAIEVYYFALNCIILIAYQMRFLPYILKTIMKNILFKVIY